MMEKGRWVTLGSRSRGRRQRRKKSSTQQFEQNESSKSQKPKQSANTPPPMAFPPRERKVSGKPNFTKENDENEISKIFNRALEDSAKRALEPIARQVDPAPTHRSPMAVKTMDYPKKSFWKKDKTQDSKNSKKKGTLTEKVPSGSTDVSDSSSQHSEVDNNSSTTNEKKRATPEKIKIEWIFEQNPTPSAKGEGSGILSTSTTPHAKEELKSWPKVKKSWSKIKKAASMPNLNPYAPSFQVNPWASSFKSFTPRPPSTVPWQPMPQQNMMSPWRSELPVFNSYPCLPPQQIQYNNNGIRNDNRESVSNLLLPYSCGPY